VTTIGDVLNAELTDRQCNAAVDPAAEVRTLACAGSGKSRTLAYRIAWLLDSGASPESILAFTFTNKAADSIQLRVASAIERVGYDPTILGRIRIGTIDSYCKQLLSDLDANYRQFEMLDLNRLHLYLMSRYGLLGLRPLRDRASKGSYFQTITEVASAWVTANNEFIPLQDIADEDPELGGILQQLRDQLLHDRFFDFSLAIRLVVEALEEGGDRVEEILTDLRHVLVDEYQDVNPVQERLIEGLHGRSDTLFVVGDDDQGLYAWRGADVSNIIEFSDHFAGCSSHTLSENFRSTKAIVTAADQFISEELGPTRIAKNPEAGDPPGTREFRRVWFENRPEEAAWVIDRVEELLGSEYFEAGADGEWHRRGLTPADIAILMRSTRSSEQDGNPRHAAFTAELERRGIPYTLEAGGGVFERPEVAAFVDTFELLREGAPTRQELQEHFRERVLSLYPHADFNATAETMAEWARLIHTPVEVERRRIYPQQLLHDLMADFNVAAESFDDGVMADIGMFSRALQDVESVFVSIDSAQRFQLVLNFLEQMGSRGYDSSNEGILRRPDAVTVATVHKVKGLEYPAVFVVDAESGRFPGNANSYSGWLPRDLLADALARGAYGNDRAQEARLFYTALTRAERYLFVSGAERLPSGRKRWKPSPFTQRLIHDELTTELNGLALSEATRQRRIDETVVPTTFSQIRYYLQCPADYKYRYVWGFSPPITEMFGFGQTVHAAVGRLHERFRTQAPTSEEAEETARQIFHLKHVPPSSDPVDRPGGYERAADAAAGIVGRYAQEYQEDFVHERQVELPFEVPIDRAVIAGAIDLLLRYTETGELAEAEVVDFKSMEGGHEPLESPKLDWTELSLQVQLYANAAREVLGENARTGSVHLLKDGQRVSVPVDDDAVEAAVHNVEWAVDGVIAEHFPMRPSATKCANCDWAKICPQLLQELELPTPPELHLPEDLGRTHVRAISHVDEARQ